jgi:hypothetical protein
MLAELSANHSSFRNKDCNPATTQGHPIGHAHREKSTRHPCTGNSPPLMHESNSADFVHHFKTDRPQENPPRRHFYFENCAANELRSGSAFSYQPSAFSQTGYIHRAGLNNEMPCFPPRFPHACNLPPQLTELASQCMRQSPRSLFGEAIPVVRHVSVGRTNPVVRDIQWANFQK